MKIIYQNNKLSNIYISNIYINDILLLLHLESEGPLSGGRHVHDMVQMKHSPSIRFRYVAVCVYVCVRACLCECKCVFLNDCARYRQRYI